ncbi:hypothetical protein HNV12_01895 [Methanococcoides sp. SA1]|nr:hypothetical protein [Methanococcoides sp. SA1]
MIKKLIILTLFLTSGFLYYNLTLESPDLITAQVTRVIDGDTLELNNQTKVRLLGINTPESNQPYYSEAKQFLSQTLAQTILLESHGPDKYQRTLGYIFLQDQNINQQILSQGLATLYYYEKDHHYKSLKEAEEQARLMQLGIWKKSPDAHCIKIITFKTSEPEQLTLQNTCNKNLSISYKDDATHIYQATLSPKEIYTKTFSHIWNDEGDTLYIYDSEGLLAFQRY